jgi:hypothetical protein
MSEAQPLYKITISDKDDNLTYTITDGVVRFKTHVGVNDDSGSFEITLPSVSGNTVLYPALEVSDIIRIWIGWDGNYDIGDPDFMGTTYQITGTLKDGQALKVIRGKSNSDILQRRIKARKVYIGIDAHTIVDELATDLGLGTSEIAADTTDITLTQDSETYADILKKISDYWYSAGSQVQKDYFVDSSFNLVWKARPIRTVGVETLTVGENLFEYTVLKDRTNLKNAIGVYGALTPFNPKDDGITGRKSPINGDSYTHGSGWTAIAGSIAANSTSPKIGSDCTRFSNNTAPYHMEGYLTLPTPINVEGLSGYSVLEFYSRRYGFNGDISLQLWAPDSSNYFATTYNSGSVDDAWSPIRRYALGANNEYNAVTNPTGQWTKNGNASWDNITSIYQPQLTAGASGWNRSEERR